MEEIIGLTFLIGRLVIRTVMPDCLGGLFEEALAGGSITFLLVGLAGCGIVWAVVSCVLG